MGEVKNVAYQALTRQLVDYLELALSNEAKVAIDVRKNTTISGPLDDLKRLGLLIIRRVLESK
jgi:hypothetical protein